MNLIALKKETILNIRQKKHKKKSDWGKYVLANKGRKKENISEHIDDIVYLNKG